MECGVTPHFILWTTVFIPETNSKFAPEKWMVRRWNCLFGEKGYFQVLLLLVSMVYGEHLWSIQPVRLHCPPTPYSMNRKFCGFNPTFFTPAECQTKKHGCLTHKKIRNLTRSIVIKTTLSGASCSWWRMVSLRRDPLFAKGKLWSACKQTTLLAKKEFREIHWFFHISFRKRKLPVYKLKTNILFFDKHKPRTKRLPRWSFPICFIFIPI